MATNRTHITLERIRKLQPPAGKQAVDQVNDHLGVGLGNEPVPGLAQAFAQPLVVFDDAVVHQRNTLARDMRMGIHAGWFAVCRPPCVRDTGTAMIRRLLLGVFQFLYLALAFMNLQALSVQERHAG